MVTDGLPDPAHELDAALGGPPCLQNQGREELARRRAFLGRRFRPPGPALILRLVGHAVLGLDRLLIEQEQIVCDRHQLRCASLATRLVAHAFFSPNLFLIWSNTFSASHRRRYNSTITPGGRSISWVMTSSTFRKPLRINGRKPSLTY